MNTYLKSIDLQSRDECIVSVEKSVCLIIIKYCQELKV